MFAEQEHFIDPSVAIVGHDWKRLRKIWNAVNADFKAALTRFTVSGTHDKLFLFLQWQIGNLLPAPTVDQQTPADWDGRGSVA